MNTPLMERLEYRIRTLQTALYKNQERPTAKRIFTVPFGKIKLSFKVPAHLNGNAFYRIHEQLKKTPVLDVDKDQDTITALAAIILLQHLSRVFKMLFERPLKHLLKRNVDVNKSMALIELLYVKEISTYKK